MNRHPIAGVAGEVDRNIASGDRGASLIEYVLLISLIFLVCLASMTAFGSTVSENVDSSASRVVEAGQ